MEEPNFTGKHNQMYVPELLTALHNEAGGILRGQVASARKEALIESAAAMCELCGGKLGNVNRIPKRHPRTSVWVHFYAHSKRIPAHVCLAAPIHELLEKGRVE